MSKKTGTLLVALSAAGFGSMSIFAKYAYSAGVNLPTLLGIRFTQAALLLWIILLITGPKPQLTIANTLTLFVLGAIGYGSQSFLFFSSLQLIPAAMAAMLFYIYPALVFLASLLLKTETITLRKVLALVMALIGLTLMLGTSFNNLNLQGLLFAFGSALVYTCYILLSNRVLKKVPTLVASTVICSSAALSFLLWGIVGGTLSLTIPLQGWIAITVIAVFSTVFAILTFFAGLNRIGATQASIISVLEPGVTVVLSYLFLSETLQGYQLLGGFLILASIIILQMPDKNSFRQSNPTSTLEEEI
ncbi:MAG: DMT family transporter [Carboxydocellales bacterium]